MTQTIDAINTVNAVIHMSADGATWVDVSGSTNKVEVSPQEADTGEAASLDGQYMIATVGKLKPVDITVTVFYTEVTGEAYDLLRIQNAKTNRPIWLRWSPKGAYNTYRYTTANGAGSAAAGFIISMPTAPGVDAGDASPALLQFKARATTVIRTVVTPSASKSPSASASPSPSLSPSASPSA